MNWIDPSPRTLLVTGPNGFIGRRLIADAKSQGWRITAAVRHAMPVSDADSTVVVGNIGAETNWTRALADCSAVAHLAGYAHVTSEVSADACYAVNLEGTKRLAEQAAAAGIQRFVFVSSIKAIAERSHGEPLTEVTRACPEDHYGRSKLLAEQVLSRVREELGLDTVILRPPLVYGPEVKANFRRMLIAIARGVPLPLGLCRNRRTLCHVGNLTSAILKCLEDPRAIGETFLIGDTKTLKLNEMINCLGSALGQKTHLLPVPHALLQGVLSILPLGSGLRKLTEDLEINVTNVCNTLEWQPPYTVEEGLDETGRWYRHCTKLHP